MTQYYVRTDGSNSNTGLSNTAGGAWLTIQKAASTVVAGDTVNVANGTYAGAISETTSGTSGAHIRYVSTNKWGAKVVPSGAGSNTMWSNSGAYIDVDGFEIAGTSIDTNVRLGIIFTGGNSTCHNCWIHNIAEHSGCDNQGGAGLLCHQANGGTAADNYEFIGNLVHNVGNGCGYIQGIYFQSSGKIQNNIVHNCTGGIHCGHDDHNVVVSNNTVFRCSVNAYYFGGCAEAYNNGCPTSGMLFYNNIVYDNTGTYAVAGPTAAEDVGNALKYNCFFGNVNNFDMAAPSQASRSNEQNVNPKFVNYLANGTGNYRLSSTSALINAGFLTYAPTTDFAGNARPYPSTAPDIGAYEFIPAGGGDTVAPILTSPLGTLTGPTTCDATVTTNEGGGILYCWVTVNPTETAANIKTNGVNSPITTASGKLFAITGLSLATTYYCHFVQEDAALNQSLVADSPSFDTGAPLVGINYPSFGGAIRRTLYHKR